MTIYTKIKKNMRYRLNQDLPRINKNTVVTVIDIRRRNPSFPCVITDDEGNMEVCRYDQLGHVTERLP